MPLLDLGPIFVRIANFDYFKEMLEKVLLFKEIVKKDPFTYLKLVKVEMVPK